jgi:D-alanyl-lipoteichoic acid acyltransferase DltB (MBOAT superfamily)
MIFTSLQFLIFFPVVAVVYFFLPNRFRCLHLLLAGYYFYMAWKPVYALLLLASSFSFYLAAIGLERLKEYWQRKTIFTLGVAFNLSLLFAFKYFNFFEAQANALAVYFGLNFSLPVLNVLLPIGISFYTFQGISYLTDVYREDMPAERHLGILMLYMAFFPQLLSGPIERGTHFIPQLRTRLLTRDNAQMIYFEYDRVVSGLRLMLLGFFKKLVLADNLALIVQPVYAAPDEYNGVSALVATLAFSFQIFFDFSAYTDIARGVARILGFDLFENFNRPYFATSIPEFWRRWHISLSTWFYNYLYMPLFFSKRRWGKWGAAFSLSVTFFLCGLWHGANWTFLIWGAMHGIFYLLTYALTPAARWLVTRTVLSRFPAFCRTFQIALTFSLVCWAWVVFRAENFHQALAIWGSIANIPAEAFKCLLLILKEGVPFAPLKAATKASGLSWLIDPSGNRIFSLIPLCVFMLTASYLVASYKLRGEDGGMAFAARSTPYRWSVYFLALAGIFLLGRFGMTKFIYFQF